MEQDSFRINVSRLFKSPIGSTQIYRVNEVVNITGINSLVQGEIRLMRTDRSILAKGKLHTEGTLSCSRCLSSFNCPLRLNIEEEYFPTINIATGEPVPLPDEPGCFTIDENNIIDLTYTTIKSQF